MKQNMLVTSPGGEMRAKYLCPNVNLKIMGVDFPAQLIVLESKDLDVILGMNWLAGHDATIQCAKRTVVTTPPEIIPYYRLNHSIWSLSDNKEASR
jgi:hypothetical protein